MEIHPGWILIREAAEKYGVSGPTLWLMVKAKILTRGRFTPAPRAKIWLRVDELEAWKQGGVQAVNELRTEAAKGA